jgi:hypothetical protein
MRGGPLSARSRLIPPFYFAPTEEAAIALSGPRCTSSIGDYADVIAAFIAPKARSPTLVGIIWKSA